MIITGMILDALQKTLVGKLAYLSALYGHQLLTIFEKDE